MNSLDFFGILIFILVTLAVGVCIYASEQDEYNNNPTNYDGTLKPLFEDNAPAGSQVGALIGLLFISVFAGGAVAFIYGIFAGLQQAGPSG